MEDSVKQTTEKIIDMVKETELYQTYSFYKERILKQPALHQKLEVFRREAHELSEAPESEIMDRTDAFREKYSDFLENPLVDDFLSAEIALVRAVQKITSDVVAALDIGTSGPDSFDGGNL